MQQTNSKINLSEKFPEYNLPNLSKVFPQIKYLIKKNETSEFVLPKIPMIVDKKSFYKMVLEKLKSYFEIKEKFIISDSLDIILKDLNNLFQKTSDKAYTKNKVEFPLITKNKSPPVKDYLLDKIKNKSLRNFSTKSNGKRKINTPKTLNLNNSFELDEPISGNINYVYLNLDKAEKQKLKIVHFADIDTELDTKRSKIAIKSEKKKSNLKKSNIKKEFNKTINFKSNDSNTNENKRRLFIKTKTQYPIRNKSNGLRLKENSQSKEKYETTEVYCPSKPSNSLYEENLNELFNIEDKDFNIFEFENKVGKENTLPLISNYIFDYFNFGDVINKEKYINWCKKITEGYNRNNPYHTDLHAADITHTSFIYFKVGLINEIIKIDKSSLCALFLSCICHDFKHPGLNNNYLVETSDLIALNFNDISVLENMHISEAFKIIHSDKNCDFFEKLDKNEYKKMRKQMISCVLSTDMSHHKNSLDFMNKCINENNQNQDKNSQDYMNLIIHSADISNPTKKFDIYYKWAELVVEEFYQQGDKEKKLGLNCSFDRNKLTLYKNQLGFIDFVEMSFFGSFIKVFPKLNYLYENLNNNREKIQLLEDENNKNNESKI